MYWVIPKIYWNAIMWSKLCNIVLPQSEMKVLRVKSWRDNTGSTFLMLFFTKNIVSSLLTFISSDNRVGYFALNTNYITFRIPIYYGVHCMNSDIFWGTLYVFRYILWTTVCILPVLWRRCFSFYFSTLYQENGKVSVCTVQ